MTLCNDLAYTNEGRMGTNAATKDFLLWDNNTTAGSGNQNESKNAIDLVKYRMH